MFTSEAETDLYCQQSKVIADNKVLSSINKFCPEPFSQ